MNDVVAEIAKLQVLHKNRVSCAVFKLERQDVCALLEGVNGGVLVQADRHRRAAGDEQVGRQFACCAKALSESRAEFVALLRDQYRSLLGHV